MREKGGKGRREGESGGHRVKEHPSVTLTQETRLALRFFLQLNTLNRKSVFRRWAGRLSERVSERVRE